MPTLWGAQWSYKEPKATLSLRSGSFLKFVVLSRCSAHPRGQDGPQMKHTLSNFIHDLISSTNTYSILTSGDPLFHNQHDFSINPPVFRMKQSIIASFFPAPWQKMSPGGLRVIHNNEEACQPWQPNNIKSLLNFKVTLFYPWQLAPGSFLIINNKKDMQSL